MSLRSKLASLILVLNGFLSLIGAASASEAHCKCGHARAVTIDAANPSWTKICQLSKPGSIKLKAAGLAYFSKNDDEWLDVLVTKVASTVTGMIVAAVCPDCGDVSGIVDKGLSKLLATPGLDKLATVFGNDPGNSSGYGSKKCGGLLLAFGSPAKATGACPCSASNVYHLVVDGKKRFGSYYKQHKYVTLSGIAKMKLKATSIYAKAWDSDHSDNLGEYAVTVVLP